MTARVALAVAAASGWELGDGLGAAVVVKETLPEIGWPSALTTR